MNRLLLVTILAGSLALVSGCGHQVVKTQVLLPARCDAAGSVRRVAVAPFSGVYWYTSRSRNLAAGAEAALAGVKVKGKPYFTVLDRQNFNRVVSEQKISLSNLADPTTAAKVGKIAGVEALLTGRVVKSGVKDSSYTVKTKECAKKNKKGKCTKHYQKEHRCVRRIASLSFIPKLIDVSTGAVLFSETISAGRQHEACPDMGQSIIAKGTLFDQAERDALSELVLWVAPHYVTMELALKDADACVKESDVAKAKFAGAQTFADAGRLDRACDLWSQCFEITRDGSVAVLFNMGVCSEIRGDYNAALDYFDQADRSLLEPDDMVNAALERVKNMLAKKSRLDSQMKGNN